MGSKIYVGGLPYSATEQELSELFGKHGAVASARIITDKFTGQSRGFGFVEMSSDAEAQAAITALNGAEMGGRTLTVNEARPQEPRTGGGGGGPCPRDRTGCPQPGRRTTSPSRAPPAGPPPRSRFEPFRSPRTVRGGLASRTPAIAMPSAASN